MISATIDLLYSNWTASDEWLISSVNPEPRCHATVISCRFVAIDGIF